MAQADADDGGRADRLSTASKKELAELRPARAIGDTTIGRVPGTTCRTAVVNARAALI